MKSKSGEMVKNNIKVDQEELEYDEQ